MSDFAGHLLTEEHPNNRAQNEANESDTPSLLSCQEGFYTDSPRDAPIEAWLRQVQPNDQGQSPRNVGPVSRMLNKGQMPGLPSAKKRGRIGCEETSECSSSLFMPNFHHSNGDPTLASLANPENSDPTLLSGRKNAFRLDRPATCFSSTPDFFSHVSHETVGEFKRRSRRKTRDNRYDSKRTTREGHGQDDALGGCRDTHRMRHKRKLRSGQQVMRNFRSQALKKEHVIIKPHVTTDLLSGDEGWDDDILADLTPHNYDLDRSEMVPQQAARFTNIGTTRVTHHIPPDSSRSRLAARQIKDNTAEAERARRGFPKSVRQFNKMPDLNGWYEDEEHRQHDLGFTASSCETPLLKSHYQQALGMDSRHVRTAQDKSTKQSSDPRCPKVVPCQSIYRNRRHTECRSTTDPMDTKQVALSFGVYNNAYMPQSSFAESGNNTVEQPDLGGSMAQFDHALLRNHSPLIKGGQASPEASYFSTHLPDVGEINRYESRDDQEDTFYGRLGDIPNCKSSNNVSPPRLRLYPKQHHSRDGQDHGLGENAVQPWDSGGHNFQVENNQHLDQNVLQRGSGAKGVGSRVSKPPDDGLQYGSTRPPRSAFEGRMSWSCGDEHALPALDDDAEPPSPYWVQRNGVFAINCNNSDLDNLDRTPFWSPHFLA